MITLATYDRLVADLGPDGRTAVELCALPHWLDDVLARALLEHGGANGSTGSLLRLVKSLPFVQPYEGRGWRLSSPAREHFTRALTAKPGATEDASRFLTEYFGEQMERVGGDERASRRELEWRSIHHLAPAAPSRYIERLEKYFDRAAGDGDFAEMNAVVQSSRTQSRWLSSAGIEAAYFEGQYAYARGDDEMAEQRFEAVWRDGGRTRLAAIAGHLLGVIWRKRRSREAQLLAADRVRESLHILRDLGDVHGEEMVLNTLAGILIDLGGRERLSEAEKLVRHSVRMARDRKSRRSEAMNLNTLGGILIDLGGESRLEEARTLLRRSVKLGEEGGDPQSEAMALNTLAGTLVDTGTRRDLREAEDLARRSLEIARAEGDRRSEAQSLNTLGRILMIAGSDKEIAEAEGLLRESLQIGRELGIRHHQAMVLNTLGGVINRRGGDERLLEAEALLEEAVVLLAELGDTRGEAMASNTLAVTLNRLGGSDRLDRAEALLRRAGDIARELGDRRSEAMGLTTLGGILISRGGVAKLREAESLLKRAQQAEGAGWRQAR